MSETATLVHELNVDRPGRRVALYHLSTPLAHLTHDLHRSEWVLVKQAPCPSEPDATDVHIYPSDESGRLRSWLELPGSATFYAWHEEVRDGADLHAAVLERAGYVLVESAGVAA